MAQLLAFGMRLAPIPEDPSLVLGLLGGAGLAWQFYRAKFRK